MIVSGVITKTKISVINSNIKSIKSVLKTDCIGVLKDLETYPFRFTLIELNKEKDHWGTDVKLIACSETPEQILNNEIKNIQ